jgi:hypothetical protein
MDPGSAWDLESLSLGRPCGAPARLLHTFAVWKSSEICHKRGQFATGQTSVVAQFDWLGDAKKTYAPPALAEPHTDFEPPSPRRAEN